MGGAGPDAIAAGSTLHEAAESPGDYQSGVEAVSVAVEVKLFLDLDGVLADFDRGVVALTGKQPAE